MASKTVQVNLSVTDERASIKQRKDEVDGLNQSLTKAAQLSEKAMRRPAARQTAGMAGENIEYGRGRGAIGATGASARDFANEAQGLGGLVRLYATYAANLFAVSAAFNALREAMNTTNMVRGLDQLGAASGVALGGLAKQFVEVTGGAITLRESMEATTKAISSGLSQKQLLQIGEVAKKASQSLGINMSDAVSRLTRGITKLEPELLDELGLFTKTGMAAEAYARSIGKSVTALTDFERRQAFANAVLAEGRQKFSEIDIPTNPYDKLLASLRNVSQTILEVINKGLVPLIDYLSQSPTALLGLITALGTMVLRQALPIFSSYRKAMAEATQEAAQQARVRMESAQKALNIARDQKAQEAKILTEGLAEQRTLRVNAEVETLKALSKGKLSKEVKGIVSEKKGILEITESDLAVLDAYGAKNTKIAAQYRDLAKAIREAQEAERNYLAQVKEIERRRDAPPPRFSTANRAAIELERARKQEAGAAIITKVGETAGTVGSLAAIKQLTEGIKTEKLGLLRGSLTAVSGAATIAATAFSGFVTIVSSFFGYLGLALTVFEALDFAFSTNSKEVDKFKNSLSLAEEAIRSAEATTKKFQDTMRPQAMIASAEALSNLKDSLTDTTEALIKADRAASGWDRFIEGFKSLYGGDLKSQFGENFARQVELSLKAITDPQLKKNAEEKLRSLFQVQDLSAQGIERAIQMLRPEQVTNIANEVSVLFTGISKQAKTVADSLRGVQDGFKNLETSYQELANQLVQNDPLSKFGNTLSQQGFMLADVFKDPIAAAAQLRDILEDTSKIRLLSPDSQRILMQNRDEFNRLSTALQSYQKQIVDTKKNMDYYASISMYDEYQQEQGKLDRQQRAEQDVRQQMIEMSKQMSQAAYSSIVKGFSIVEGGFNRTIATGILNAQKSLVDKLPQTQGTIRLGTELENRKIDLQIEEIRVTEQLIKEMELARLQGERRLILEDRNRALENVTDPRLRIEINRGTEARLEPIRKREALLESTNISEDIKKGKIDRTPESYAAMQRQMGTFAKLRTLEDQKQLNTLNEAMALTANKFAMERKGYQQTVENNQKMLEAFRRSDEFRNLSLEDQQTLEDGFARSNRYLAIELATLEERTAIGQLEAALAVARKNNWTKVVDLVTEDLAVARERLYSEQSYLALETQGLETERQRANESAKRAKAIELSNIAREKEATLQQLQSGVELQLLNMDKERLGQLFEQGRVTTDVYNAEIRVLERSIAVKERDASIRQLQARYLAEIIPLVEQYRIATAAEQATISARMQAITQTTQAEIDGVNRVFAAQQQLRASRENLTERQVGYGKIIERSFEGMADAIVEFTKTGKLNFKDMVGSMIQDLVRLELRMQAALLYQAVRPGLMTFVSGLVGGPGVGGNYTSAERANLAGLAKGGAFDSGVQKFAKGGMFTNKIVAEPTLFKFAKGAGVMGEAGPEAIMPLRRDGEGNLGVIAQPQQGKVEVVVNNFSGEKAETRETVDSRGNRKIEVIVGEMVAGELGRKNSPVQQSMMANFMAKPATVRR